jgi:hypothetical protein
MFRLHHIVIRLFRIFFNQRMNLVASSTHVIEDVYKHILAFVLCRE